LIRKIAGKDRTQSPQAFHAGREGKFIKGGKREKTGPEVGEERKLSARQNCQSRMEKQKKMIRTVENMKREHMPAKKGEGHSN